MEDTNEIRNLVGDTLLTHDNGNIVQISFNDWYAKFNASAKYLCFYFGAHWAPPCRIFTKSLNDGFYS